MIHNRVDKGTSEGENNIVDHALTGESEGNKYT